MEEYDSLYRETRPVTQQKKVLVVEKDVAFQKLLLVWEIVPRDHTPYKKKKKNEMPEGWWSACVVSLSEWCSLAGIPDSVINIKKCETLMRLGIVVPDGRVHYWVEKYLQHQAERMVVTKTMKVTKGGKK